MSELRAGSKEARRALIESYLGMAFEVTRSFDDDEALSECLYKLVVAVNEFANMPQESFSKLVHPEKALTNYIRVTLERAACDTVRGRGRDRNQRTESMEALDASTVNDAWHFTKRHHKLRMDSDGALMDQVEFILAACETERERFVVCRLAQGYTQRETARMVDMSTTRLCEMLKKLEHRVSAQQKLIA